MKIVVKKIAGRPKFAGRTFEDIQAWDILRAYEHISVDDRRSQITLGCRITGDRFIVRADNDALLVKPATFHRVINGYDELDLFLFAEKYLKRKLTWEEKDLALAQAMRFGDQVNPQTVKLIFAYCCQVSCEEAWCASCKQVFRLTHYEVKQLAESDVIPPKYTCVKCRRMSDEQTSQTEEDEGVGEGEPRGEGQGDVDPDGHGGDYAEAGDRRVVP